MIFEILALFILICSIYHFYSWNAQSTKNLPPGPWGIPILGHLPFLGNLPHVTLSKWSKKYGPVIFVRFGSLPTVVLNDTKTLKEAGNLLSFTGRADIKALVEGTKCKGIAWSEGSHYAEQRQFAVKNLKEFGLGKAAVEFSIQEEIQELIESIKQNSSEFFTVHHMFSPYVINSLWFITMGQRFEKDSPILNHLIDVISNKLSKADTLLSKMSMFLPWIGTWMPKLSGYDDRVSVFRDLIGYLNDKISEEKLTWVKGQPRHFTDAYFDKVDDTTDENSSFHIKHGTQAHTLNDIFMATIDTTNTLLEWFLYQMARNPQIQLKLQQEIESIVGTDRRPCLNDRKWMPYAEAIIHEILRINPALPLALFHRTVDKVQFNGYEIPKDTSVVFNLYSALNDESVWDDPRVFKPERFLDSEGKLKKFDSFLAFGTGKRSCPGEVLGRDQLFLYATSICQQFQISLPPNTPDLIPIFGITLAIPSFQIKFDERKLSLKLN